MDDEPSLPFWINDLVRDHHARLCYSFVSVLSAFTSTSCFLPALSV